MKRYRPAVLAAGILSAGWIPAAQLLGILGPLPSASAEIAPAAPEPPRVVSIIEGEVKVSFDGKEAGLRAGGTIGPWTLMAIVPQGQGQGRALAVFEDFTRKDGHMVFADPGGIPADLPKSCEPTFADPAGLYRGHKLDDVLRSDRDLLAEEILARGGDPSYAEVAACFPPISKMYTYRARVGS
jgi:hypothetical protein